MEKNIKWLYIIIFQSLTLKYWFYIIYDFLSVFSYSNFIYTNYNYKNKGKHLLMDNATIHHTKKIKEYIKKKDINVIYNTPKEFVEDKFLRLEIIF